jgi:hypothetical protein
MGEPTEEQVLKAEEFKTQANKSFKGAAEERVRERMRDQFSMGRAPGPPSCMCIRARAYLLLPGSRFEYACVLPT